MMEEISVDETTASIDLDYNETENTDKPATITPAPAIMDISSTSSSTNTKLNRDENDKEVIQGGVFETTSTISKTRINDQMTPSESNSSIPSIEIKVGQPTKIGEGMSSFVCYKVITRTTLPFFRRNSFSVNRRFSDFLGLRDKLAEKHIHLGHIVPPAPEKDAVNNAKVIMSKEEASLSSDFLGRRAASLERFLNRIAQHPDLRSDPDFREFLELESDLPRAKSTSALSGAGVRRLFTRVGDTVNKMTFRMDETDPWFEEKQQQIENLDQQLRKLHASVEGLIHCRKELTTSTGAFAKSAAMLGNCEEHNSLSCALSHLAETHEKIEQLHNDQANNDFFLLSEPLRDYISLIGVIKEVFHQRVKVYQSWQNAQQMLTKKREAKVRFEIAGKSDKIPQAQEEISEWESKVTRGQEEFDLISRNMKKEVEKFELDRINDFKTSYVKYIESLLSDQQQLILYWEAFLPEAQAIS